MRYKIVDKLGEGGMGVVYRAHDQELNRDVAIKFLQSSAEDLTEGGKARFKREMEVLLALSHPSIVSILDAGESEDRLYYVMELLEAKDLDRILKDEGPLPVRAVLDVLDQMFDALDAIHARKLVHRDIKPANIMLERTGRAVLMDFGLVRKSEATLLTADGKVLGTPRYISPEGIRGETVVPASDQWSLGVTAYELLTGVRPFGGQNLTELATAILRADPGPPSQHRAELPKALDELIMRLLRKSAADRFPGAKDALAAVRQLSGSSSGEMAVAHLAPEWLGRTQPKRPTARTKRPTRLTASVPAAAATPPASPSPTGSMRAAALGFALTIGAGALALVATRERPAPAPSPSATVLPARQEPSPAERVAQLAGAVRTARLSEADTDLAWRKIRVNVPKWNQVTSGQPGHARRAIEKDPSIKKPLDDLVARINAEPGLAEALQAVRPLAAKVLADLKTPPDMASDLVDALARLDFVDSLADYMGQPPPFGVRALLEPVLETRRDATPFVRSATKSIFPGERAGVAVFHPKQYGTGFSTADLTVVSMSEASVVGREPTAMVRFTVPPLPPGATGVVLHMRTQRFPPQTYMYMKPAGFPVALPVRQPPGDYLGTNARLWVTAIFKGPLLARAGPWTIEHRRTFEDGSPMAFSIDEVVFAPLAPTH